MTSPAATFLLPLSPAIGADTIAGRAVNAFRSGNLRHAFDAAMFMRRNYPSLLESHGLYASILAAMHRQKESLEAWNIITENPSMNVAWLERAIAQAFSNNDSRYIERWLTILERMFLQPPSVGLLASLTAAGRHLRGCVGINCNRVVGWSWMSAGAKAVIEVYGGPPLSTNSVSTRICNSHQLTTFSIELPPSDSPFFLRITDEKGTDLNGSPLACEPPMILTPATGPHGNCELPPAVVVPVYDDRKATELCLRSLMDSQKDCSVQFDIVVVWDHGPDIGLFRHLCKLAGKRKIHLLSTQRNIGFLGSVNLAMRQFSNRDLVLLNADTIVYSNWLDRLHQIAERMPDTGTITPLGSNAEFLSYPDRENPADVRTLADTAAIDRACRQAAGGEVCHEIPVGIGFCMYLTRTMLQKVGCFDGYLLYSGYFEEVDLCLRASEAGFSNLAALNVFVAHLGSRSFGSAKRALVAQNSKAISRRYPEYMQDCVSFLRKDPLRSHRESISLLLYSPLNYPLHILGSLDLQTPEAEPLNQPIKNKRKDRAVMAISSQGGQNIASLKAYQRFELAEIRFPLPGDNERLKEALSRLSPESLVVHGFSKPAWEMAREIGLPAELRLNSLSRELLSLWLDRKPCPADIFHGFKTVTCHSSEIAAWLAEAGLDVKTVPGRRKKPRLLPGSATTVKEISFLVPTPRTVEDWRRLCNEAERRREALFHIPMLKEGWQDAPRPSNIRECPPLSSDDTRLLAEAVLVATRDPELLCCWSLWAARQGISCYITEEYSGLDRKRI